MALDDNPIKGPFPTGDSRNITLTQGSNPMEPERTGPQEPIFREDGAPRSVIGQYEQTELRPGADAPTPNTNPQFVHLGNETPGQLIASLTPGSETTSAMNGLLDKVRHAYGLDQDDSASDARDQVTTQVNIGSTAEPYSLQQEPEPDASDYAFGVKGGGLVEPVLQEDWNPAERNSDDLSR